MMPAAFLLLLPLQLAPPPAAPAQARPQPPTATLTLAEALSRSRAAAPLVVAERARAEALARAARVAGRFADPSLDLRVENWRGGSDFDAGRDLDVFAVALQPLELSGTRGARKRTAEGDSAEAGAVLLGAERQAQVEAARAYARVAAGQALVAALESQAERLRDVVRMLDRRVQEGWAAEADLAKFQGELARAEIQLLRSRLERDAARRRLQALLAAPLPELALDVPGLPPVPEGDPAALAAAAVDALPEVRAAAARLARADGALSLERAKGRPDLALAGGYKRTQGLDTAVAGVVVAMPVFERNGRSRAQAEGEALAAATLLKAARDEQRAALAALVAAARALAERASRVEQDLVQPTEVARAAALSAFREGATDALRLVDAERAHAEARREALELTVDALAASIEARLALGLEALP
jgi:cobalt-zinc-cadmium efflux system outer membrane protein